MEKHKKIQIVKDFLTTIKKTDEMENNNSIPSVASQYKYKKEELFDNFVLSIIQLIPEKTTNFFDTLKFFFFIIQEKEKLSIHKEFSLNDFLIHIYEKAEKNYNEDDQEYLNQNHRSKENVLFFIKKIKIIIHILETEWEFFHFDETDTKVFARGYRKNSFFDYYHDIVRNQEEKTIESFFNSKTKNIIFTDIDDLF